MYKQGKLITVNGNIYEYHGFDKEANVHLVYEVDIDCDGILTATYTMNYFYPEQFTEGFGKINLTKPQWYGVVSHLLRNDYMWSKVLYNLTEEEIAEATEDIVERCFAYGIPKFEELEDYIAEYMNR